MRYTPLMIGLTALLMIGCGKNDANTTSTATTATASGNTNQSATIRAVARPQRLVLRQALMALGRHLLQPNPPMTTRH